ncbi:MAG TPA: hypothetical protein VF930_11420 [Stellaceae bacterium]
MQDHLKGGRCELRHVSLHLSGDGEPAPFSLAVLDKFLGQFIEFRSHHCWSLSFPNGGTSFLYLKDDQNEIDHACVNRPADSPELWIGLLDILRETGGMLCWPGGGAVVADEAHIAHLPPEMIKILGRPTVVGSGREIEECIEKS